MLCKLGSKGPPSFLSTPGSAASVTHEPTARKPGETILASRKSRIMLTTRTRRTLATTTGGAAAHDSFGAAGMAPRPPRPGHPTFVYPALIEKDGVPGDILAMAASEISDGYVQKLDI